MDVKGGQIVKRFKVSENRELGPKKDGSLRKKNGKSSWKWGACVLRMSLLRKYMGKT